MNAPRFSRGEYWLLVTVVDMSLTLRLVGQDDVAEALNKPSHGLSRDALADAFVDLLGGGLIRISSEERGQIAPSHDQIVEALAAPRRARSTELRYELTSAGGAAWEAFAAPNWNRFVDDSSTPDDEYEIICADRRFLELYLAAMRRAGQIDETTLVHDELTPWQATY